MITRLSFSASSGQKRPAPQGRSEHQVGLPRELQRVPGELDVAPVGKFPGEAVLMLLQVGLSMLAIILVRKVEVDRRIVHDGNSRIHETNGMNPAVKLGSRGGEFFRQATSSKTSNRQPCGSTALRVTLQPSAAQIRFTSESLRPRPSPRRSWNCREQKGMKMRSRCSSGTPARCPRR